MNRIGARVIALALACVSLSAQGLSNTTFEQITVANTAIGFTTTKILNVPTAQGTMNAVSAVCDLETADVRYTIDGTTPTSTVGMYWTANTSIAFGGNTVLRAFRAIRVTGSSGQLNCTYQLAPQ